MDIGRFLMLVLDTLLISSSLCADSSMLFDMLFNSSSLCAGFTSLLSLLSNSSWSLLSSRSFAVECIIDKVEFVERGVGIKPDKNCDECLKSIIILLIFLFVLLF